MSRKIRPLTLAFVLAVLATGSVGALPFDSSKFEGNTSFLSAMWEWLASSLGSSAPDPQDPEVFLEKEGPQLDPDGHS